jgi:C4-dicarboxylate-specific signal transduction histidine kinase
MNVIGNAIDALEEVKKGDKGYSPTIWISTEVTADNTVTVKIRDNGPGIAPGCAQQIFDPIFYYKVDRQRHWIGVGYFLSNRCQASRQN